MGIGVDEASTHLPPNLLLTKEKKNIFVKAKRKDHVPTQEPIQKTSFQNERKTPSRVFYPNKDKTSSKKSRNVGKNQYPPNKRRTYDTYHDSSSRHSYHASFSRPRMQTSNHPHSTY